MGTRPVVKRFAVLGGNLGAFPKRERALTPYGHTETTHASVLGIKRTTLKSSHPVAWIMFSRTQGSVPVEYHPILCLSAPLQI